MKRPQGLADKPTATPQFSSLDLYIMQITCYKDDNHKLVYSLLKIFITCTFVVKTIQNTPQIHTCRTARYMYLEMKNKVIFTKNIISIPTF